MSLSAEQFTHALADPTRLRILMMLNGQPERCVCELTQALDLPQPKISRHLAVLRGSGILLDRRQGLWIHYRIHPQLPLWAARVLDALTDGCADRTPYREDARRLREAAMLATGTCG